MVKKYLFRLFSLGFIILCCTACPYESEVPVSEALNLDPSLLGKWKQEMVGTKNEDYMEVRQLDEKQYLVVEYNYNQVQKQFATKEYVAHLSELNGTKFWNVKVKKLDEKNTAPPKGYFLHKIVIKSDKQIVLLPFSEHIREKFNSSADLQAFIQKHMNLSFFYGAEQNFTKLN